MGMKPNYFKIGIFVIVAVVLIVAAMIIFGAGLFAKEKIYFETYFDSSVSGLNVGAPVENRGVRMGRVERITFVSTEYELPFGSEVFFKYQHYVMVVASIDAENLPAVTPEERKANLKRLISAGLRVRLASNMLTGQAYLQADYLDPQRFPTLEVPWEPRNLYVPSAPGELSTLKQSVDRILFRLEKIDTERIGLAVEEVLASLDKQIDDANIGAVAQEMKNLFAEARGTNQHIQKLLASKKVESEMANLPEVVDQLSQTLQRIDKLVSAVAPQIERTLQDVRQISTNLKDLSEDLKRHPSELIFSRPPPKSEVLK